MISRAEAMAKVEEWVPNKNLRKHMFCVEACLRWYAKELGEDEELWGLTGLLHDLDWEKYPEEHPAKAIEWLKSIDAPAEMIQAIASHGNDQPGGTRFTKRGSLLDHYLFAVDELSGLVIATALVRPDKLSSLEATSVIKKLKDKTFAKGVNRDDITESLPPIKRTLEDHVTNVIAALQGIRDVLEL